MSRKLSSVVAVLAFLSLSLAGAAQARPLAAPAAESFLQRLCHWVAAGVIRGKEGPGMDPNDHKRQRSAPELSFGGVRVGAGRAAAAQGE
jgi:hypothetical protein